MKKTKALTRGAAALLISAVYSSGAQTQTLKPGIETGYIDSTCNPCQDFYGFCNGKWQKTFQLPASDARYGSFNEVNDNNLRKIKAIYDDAVAGKAAAPNTDAQRMRDFYMTAMDSAKAEQLGMAPIAPQLAMISAVKNVNDFMALKAKFENLGVNLLFNSWVSPDLKRSTRNILSIGQAGYGLNDRDYYHLPQHESIREEYKKYLEQLFIMTGSKKEEATHDAQMILDFETSLTIQALTRAQMRDIEKSYNLYSHKTLNEITPAIDWTIYFREKKISWPDTLNVSMVDYMRQMSAILESTPLPTLQAYARAQLLMESAPYLTLRSQMVHFAFRGKTMSGAKVMKSRWQRVHNVMNAGMGDIASREFVKRHFPQESKQRVNKMIDNLVASYRARIATREWMQPETKQAANRKLDLMIRKIGYPDKWKDYTGMQIGTENYWANICSMNTWLTQDNLRELKKPVDRTKWQMTPVTVNAYYDPTTNEITFPAAILQPPFFDPKADDAANYGIMGSVIGHELTHGFDDQGSQFDADGNMKMWWNEKDLKNFKDRTGRIVDQFNGYVAIDTLHVNGDMTQGENIADLGGVTMAYYAYKRSLMGKPSKVIGGYTGEQRFFIAWAQGWKTMTRDAELKRLLTVDYHSPGYFRAFAPLTNMPEFYQTFGVKPGDKMHRSDEQRVEIW